MGRRVGERSDELEGKKQSACADEDEEDADEAHHGFCGKNLAELGSEGCGDYAPKNQAGDDGKIF